MLKPFTGFSNDRHKTVRVPEGFFEDLLPHITSMLEMKVTLYLFWRLARGGRQGSSPRMVSLPELEGDEELRLALTPNRGPRPVDEALREGLELAVGRGTILQIWVREEPNDVSEGRAELWYVLNTRENRAWIEGLGSGEIDLAETPFLGAEGGRSARFARPVRIIAERPNIFALYEQNIGLLTPILAEQLQDAEGRYPLDWIEDAFREALANNKRSWRYIERILERWASEGKDIGQTRGRPGRGLDQEKYTKGKYAFLFRPD